MINEKIEILGKELHQISEEWEINCKTGDGFMASFIVGRLSKLQSEMLKLSKQCQEMNQNIEVENKVAL